MKLTTENTENTESDTPETDKAIKYWPSENAELVDANFARKLERERDEAMSDLEFRRGLYKVLEEANSRLVASNKEAVALALTLKQERDEARQKMADALQEVDLRTLDYERMKQERDEARRELNEIRAERDLAKLSSLESDQMHDRMVGELERVYKERDEARQLLASAQNALDAIHLGVGSWISKMKQSK